MIKTLYSTVDGETFTVDLKNDVSSGLVILNIDGLGPSRGLINTTEGPNLPGSKMNSRRSLGRHIAVSFAIIGMDPELIRQSISKFFPVAKMARLGIITDHRHVYVDFSAESNEANIFRKMANSDLALTCPAAYLTDITPGTFQLAGTTASFMFPFGNELYEPDQLMFGNLLNQPTEVVDYTGDADTGFEITLNFTGPVTDNISLFNTTHNQHMTIDVSKVESTIAYGGIQEGDAIFVNTNVGEKEVRFIRQGVRTNIINSLGKTTTWLVVYPGNNAIAIAAEDSIYNIEANFEYRLLYSGV